MVLSGDAMPPASWASSCVAAGELGQRGMTRDGVDRLAVQGGAADLHR